MYSSVGVAMNRDFATTLHDELAEKRVLSGRELEDLGFAIGGCSLLGPVVRNDDRRSRSVLSVPTDGFDFRRFRRCGLGFRIRCGLAASDCDECDEQNRFHVTSMIAPNATTCSVPTTTADRGGAGFRNCQAVNA